MTAVGFVVALGLCLVPRVASACPWSVNFSEQERSRFSAAVELPSGRFPPTYDYLTYIDTKSGDDSTEGDVDDDKRAEAQSAEGLIRFLWTIIIVADLVSPEMGLEFDEDPGVILGWYPHVGMTIDSSADDGRAAFGHDGRPIFRLSLFGGPEVSTTKGEVRGLLGVAPTFWPFRALMIGADGGYALGTDGSGPFAGLSLGAGSSDTFAFILTGRHVWLDGRERVTVGVDLRLFWTDLVHF